MNGEKLFADNLYDVTLLQHNEIYMHDLGTLLHALYRLYIIDYLSFIGTHIRIR